MSDYVNDALLDASPLRKQQDEAKALVRKWDKTGLLEGLNEDFQKNGMAVMLENQARQLINEFTGTGGRSGGTTSAASGTEEWSGVALPLVRRIFGEIVSQEFVSVQPMNLPSGLVFYLDFKYGTSTSGFTAGDSLGGDTGEFSPIGTSTTSFPDKGLYGVGRYGYSLNTGSALGIGGIGPAFTNGGIASYSDINFDADVSASKAGNLVNIQ